MSVDLKTLLLADAAFAFALAAVVIASRAGIPGRIHGVWTWAFADAALGLGRLLVGFEDSFSSYVGSVFGNSLLLTGYFLHVFALSQFLGRPIRTGWAFAGPLIALGVFGAIEYGNFDLTVRLIAFGLGTAFLAIVALRFVKVTAETAIGTQLLALSLILLIILSAIRTWGAYDARATSEFALYTGQLAYYAGMITVNFLATIGFVLAIHESARSEIERLSRSDSLTGLHSRRGLLEELNRELARAERSQKPAAIAVIDLNQLKRANREWGHTAGDKLLVDFADLLVRMVRPTDVVGRYSSEEFVIILSGSTADAAASVVERLNKALHARPIGPKGLPLTLCAGVADSSEHDIRFDVLKLLSTAESRLERAKQSRRLVIGPSSLRAVA